MKAYFHKLYDEPLEGGRAGVSKASGFIQRMMAEEKAGVTEGQRGFRKFDWKKLANSEQSGDNRRDADYGASPDILSRFGKQEKRPETIRALTGRLSAMALRIAKALKEKPEDAKAIIANVVAILNQKLPYTIARELPSETIEALQETPGVPPSMKKKLKAAKGVQEELPKSEQPKEATGEIPTLLEHFGNLNVDVSAAERDGKPQPGATPALSDKAIKKLKLWEREIYFQTRLGLDISPESGSLGDQLEDIFGVPNREIYSRFSAGPYDDKNNFSYLQAFTEAYVAAKAKNPELDPKVFTKRYRAGEPEPEAEAEAEKPKKKKSVAAAPPAPPAPAPAPPPPESKKQSDYASELARKKKRVKELRQEGKTYKAITEQLAQEGIPNASMSEVARLVKQLGLTGKGEVEMCGV
jgi:hypothetical protein